MVVTPKQTLVLSASLQHKLAIKIILPFEAIGMQISCTVQSA